MLEDQRAVDRTDRHPGCCFVICLNSLMGRKFNQLDEGHQDLEGGESNSNGPFRLKFQPGNAIVCCGILLLIVFIISASFVFRAKPTTDVGLVIYVTGSFGGLDQSGLSGYLLGLRNGTRSLQDETPLLGLDMGTSIYGIRAGVLQQIYRTALPTAIPPPYTREGYIFTHLIKGYVLTHPHIDHWLGVILAAPEELAVAKPIYTNSFTQKELAEGVLDWRVWPNIGSTGTAHLSMYNFTVLDQSTPDNITYYPAEDLPFTIAAFPLSHGMYPTSSKSYKPYPSLAFWVKSTVPNSQLSYDSILYLGDTGSDLNEKSDNLKNLWKSVAPAIMNSTLKAIMIECSFDDSTTTLYGHLNPKALMGEMHSLFNELTNIASEYPAQTPSTAIKSLKIIVTHIKPINEIKQIDIRTVIQLQLTELNDLGLSFIFPMQGNRIEL